MQKNNKRAPLIELVMIIINRDGTEKAVKVLNNLQIDLQMISIGEGTADSSLSDYLGLDKKEKSVIFCVVKLKDKNEILSVLNEKLKFDKKNTGVALTIPIKSAPFALIERMGFVFEK